jgi:hypothetical protein
MSRILETAFNRAPYFTSFSSVASIITSPVERTQPQYAFGISLVLALARFVSCFSPKSSHHSAFYNSLLPLTPGSLSYASLPTRVSSIHITELSYAKPQAMAAIVCGFVRFTSCSRLPRKEILCHG